jgi:UDP-glucuronate decarboxylase
MSSPLTHLHPDDRVLVTGAAGWMGRELLASMRLNAPNVQLMALGRTNREITVDGQPIRILSRDPASIAAWRPTIVVHLAYVTREARKQMGDEDYQEHNERISDVAIRLLDIKSLRAYVLASSGAAVAYPQDLYGQLKARDEARFLEAAAARGVPLVVARIWSVSGSQCTKPHHFAFYDLIRQSLYEPHVSISSLHEVWRRYVDAGEFLRLCIAIAKAGVTTIVDSAGELVEIGQLAFRIQQALGVEKFIGRLSPQGTPDFFACQDMNMDTWAREFLTTFTPLDQQIRRSSICVINNF